MNFNEMVETVDSTDTSWSDFSTSNLFDAFKEIDRSYDALKNVLDGRVMDIADKYAKATGRSIFDSLDRVDYYGNEIEVNTSYCHCQSCGTDYKSISFPARLLKISPYELDVELNKIKTAREQKEIQAKNNEKQRALEAKFTEFNKLKAELTQEGIISNEQ